ncbi:MAG: phosphocholine-specific phospholipase C [Chitinophagaceae bacterium]
MQDSRRDFIKKATMLAGATGMAQLLPASIQRAMAISADPGTTFMDAEHVVFLMQENRSFDHCYGTLKGVRGFNDPRALRLPNGLPVWMQQNKNGDTYAPFRLDIKNSKATWMGSLPHSWTDMTDARNNGKMDNWLEAKKPGNKNYKEMPLTMGFYDRNDIPFYYSLADAFTVCDQHFCSSLTGTSTNRTFFWSAAFRPQPHNPQSLPHVMNGQIDHKDITWKTFPERLEEAGVSWKVYQNELSIPVGLEDEADGWLANFTDNSLEFYKQYNVRLHPAHLDFLAKLLKELPGEIEVLTKELSANPADTEKTKKLEEKKKLLKQVEEASKEWNAARWEKLSEFEKNLHKRAFVTNTGDPDYHEVEAIFYGEGSERREVKVPKGDIFHQFRKDVNAGELPAVSWLVAPCNFSDHPGAPWYGAWYVSEALDILTKNPEVWKKTIFILTYDENDGYFDHVPPFVPPHTDKPWTGAVSKGMDTRAEWVTMDMEEKRTSKAESRRESPIGLGFRVPLVIASPWTRGGWVNSEVFDHTSSLQFLETWLSGKGKNIREENLTEWRRTVCGDLTSVFRPAIKETGSNPTSLKRDQVVEDIHRASFKALPGNYKKLTPEQVSAASSVPQQEPGTRPSCALPSEWYADAAIRNGVLEMNMGAGNRIFGKRAIGAAYQVYAPVEFKREDGAGQMHNWNFTVKAGDEIRYVWPLDRFSGNQYHLIFHGANGFFREYKGDSNEHDLEAKLTYSKGEDVALLTLTNKGTAAASFMVTDTSYKTGEKKLVIKAGGSASYKIALAKTGNWYDVVIRKAGSETFQWRFAGRIETGKPSITDPLMGKVIA